MPFKGFAVINESLEKSRRLKRAVLIGVLLTLAIIGWHIYQNSFNKLEDAAVKENELSALTQKLYELELQNEPYSVHINLQCKTNKSLTNDCSPRPLFDDNNNVAGDINSTLELMKDLHKYYNFNVSAPEDESQEKALAELQFLNAILRTPIMKQAMTFLGEHGFSVYDEDRQLKLLRDIWFTRYTRAKGPVGSTGFEHVFLAEIRKSKTLGLHNWVYLMEQEKLGFANYHGYVEHIDLGKHNLHLLSLRLAFHNKLKPYTSIFIGSSPEFELSLYTICFSLYAQKPCPIQLGSIRFSIMTYSIFNVQQQKTLGSAYLSLID